jgi:uncharacterized OsmC-like protein
MNYSVNASISSNKEATVHIKESEVNFGISPDTEASLPNPAELFLGSFSACILKNVARFSVMMNFEYSSAELKVNAVRLEKPPRMDEIQYELIIYSEDDSLNIDLVHKNIQKFGTIFNTVKACCTVSGTIKKIAVE